MDLSGLVLSELALATCCTGRVITWGGERLDHGQSVYSCVRMAGATDLWNDASQHLKGELCKRRCGGMAGTLRLPWDASGLRAVAPRGRRVPCHNATTGPALTRPPAPRMRPRMKRLGDGIVFVSCWRRWVPTTTRPGFSHGLAARPRSLPGPHLSFRKAGLCWHCVIFPLGIWHGPVAR